MPICAASNSPRRTASRRGRGRAVRGDGDRHRAAGGDVRRAASRARGGGADRRGAGAARGAAMIFTELRFVALFVACWITFYLVPRRYRAAVLALWGAAFYLIYAGPFFVVVLVLAILAFFSGRRALAWLTGIATVG